MEQNRIGMSDIHVGKPLPWNAYNARGQLLLKKGFVVESLSQVAALVEQGLYADASLSHEDDIHSAQARETPSVLRMLNLAEKRLERLLFGVSVEPDFPAKLMEVATSVIAATEQNSDIALACILLNQQTDDYPVRHGLDTAVVAILVAQSMNLTHDEIATLTAAALTMNVGMLRQQAQLQHKLEAPSAKEIESIHQHQLEGAGMLEGAGVHDAGWLAYVRSHHASEFGGDYPDGHAGEEISSGTKILALADRYCASISERKHHKSHLPSTALREIFLEKGKGIDPTLAAYFIKVLGLYPPGTLVRLNNGEIGVVSKKGDGPLTPIVHALVGPHGVALSIPVRRDTAGEPFAIKEALHVDQADIRFSMHQVWGEEASL
ncbi:MAG: metal-dependent phosphohydrolase [Betaproteobacteria bacterium]|nr:metal-dependent phosphohydrolase [Betaproteobacteria bacterium]